MEMTLPCYEHQSVEKWYKKPTPTTSRLHYAVHEGHLLPVRESYAKLLAERRRREYYLRAFLRLLTRENRVVLEFARAVTDESSLEQRFREQAEKWQRETEHLSSPTQRIMHPSYQAILGMGRAVVPLLLRDMQQNRRAWFWALSYLTHENPINPKDAGRMDKMIKAWEDWGRERGLL